MKCKNCGQMNESNVDRCLMCGSNLLFVAEFIGIGDAIGINFEIPFGETCVIGRKEKFQAGDLYKNEISVAIAREKQCELFYRDGDCFIIPRKAKNPTYLLGEFSNIALPVDAEFKLTEKTRIGFGSEDIAFTVHLKEYVPEKIVEEVKMGWIITCPECGNRHLVSDEKVIVEVCSNCGDDQIKYEFARWERV